MDEFMDEEMKNLVEYKDKIQNKIFLFMRVFEYRRKIGYWSLDVTSYEDKKVAFITIYEIEGYKPFKVFSDIIIGDNDNEESEKLTIYEGEKPISTRDFIEKCDYLIKEGLAIRNLGEYLKRKYVEDNAYILN
ncbi:MAG: hypothetical protein RMJ37_02860 [Spirochaetia bacterium]|nr:hypothetical protein [Spirochaetota bacterium]MDW8112267.1 hypothetical protein [Spirochaetia bacterium]